MHLYLRGGLTGVPLKPRKKETKKEIEEEG
jgi:hypothetical protein